MSNLSKLLYCIMLITIVVGMSMDASKGLFDTWKFNTLCWVAIAYMLERRTIRAEKQINENNKYH